MKLAHWIHHLFNPHCPECREEAQEKKVCDSCETYKMQLAIVNAEKRQLLEAILYKPTIEEPKVRVDYEKLRPKQMAWPVLRQHLEAEDRKAASVLKTKADEIKLEAEKARIKAQIEKLEKETGVHAETNGRVNGEALQSEEHEAGEEEPLHEKTRIQ